MIGKYLKSKIALTTKAKQLFCNKTYFIRERLNSKDIEDPLKEKVTTELMNYLSNSKYNLSHNWLTFPSTINPISKSVNSIYSIIVQDVLNRIKLQQGMKIKNLIQVKSTSQSEVEEMKGDLKALGVLFDESNLLSLNNKKNYLSLLRYIRELLVSNKLVLGNTTVLWDKASKTIVEEKNLEEYKELISSIFVKLPINNKEVFIDNLTEMLNETEVIEEKTNKFPLLNKKKDYDNFITLVNNENTQVNIIGFLSDPWRYLGVSAIEVNENMNFCAFRVINTDKFNKNEIFLCSSKRVPEIIKKMDLKQSNNIEIILHFRPYQILSNIICKDQVYSRELPLVYNDKVSEFYGSGVNILVPGHDAVHEKICNDNGINYRGYINDNNDVVNGLEIFSPKSITNEYMIKLLLRKGCLLSEFEYQFSSFINKQNNNRLIIKTIPCLRFLITKKDKVNIMKEFNKVSSIPEGKFENKGKKITKGFYSEEASTYKHLIEELDTISTYTITKPYKEILDKSNNSLFKNVALPLKVNEGYSDNLSIDIELLDRFILFIQEHNEGDIFDPYVNDKFKLTEKDKIMYLYIDETLYEACIWNLTKTEVLSKLTEDEVKSMYLNDLLKKIELVDSKISGKSLSEIDEFISQILDNKQESHLLQKELLKASSYKSNELNKLLPSNIICLQKEHHTDLFIKSAIFSYYLTGTLPYSTLKTLGHILSKKGEVSKINYRDIIFGIETFDLLSNEKPDQTKFGYGADTLRILLSANDEDKDIILLESDIAKAKNDIRSIRRMGRQLSLLYNLKDENLPYVEKYIHKLNDLKQSDFECKPLDLYNKKLLVDYDDLNIIDQFMLYKYDLYIRKISSLSQNERLKDIISETLEFIQEYVNYYLLVSLRRLSELSESNKKEHVFLLNLYILIWINTQSIISLLSILSPIIPFNTQFIYEALIERQGFALMDIKLKTSEEVNLLIPQMSFRLNENLIMKFNLLSEIQVKVRKFTIASAKLNKIPIKDLTVCFIINKGSAEESIFLTIENDLKLFFNVNNTLVFYSKDEIAVKGKFRTLYNKQVKVSCDDVRLKFDIYILCDINYKREENDKEQSDAFEKPFEQSNNNKIDKFYVEKATNKRI